jgi:hypothetical protein
LGLLDTLSSEKLPVITHAPISCPGNKEKKKEPEEGEKKGLRKIFNLDGQNKKSD